MAVRTPVNTLVDMRNPHFIRGYELGRIRYFKSSRERLGEPDDEYLVGNVKMYCEKGLHTDPDWLAERVGFLMGMVSGLHIPEGGNR